MEHVAIDLGGRESQICARRADGSIIEEVRLSTRELRRYLERRPPSVVTLETCAEAFSVADTATTLGHTVRVVPSALVRSLGVGARGMKNDVRDAQALSAASCRMELPSVHIPSQSSRQRKTLCGMRDALVASRTQLINTVRGWLRADAVQLKTGAAESFVARVRSHLERSSTLTIPRCVERQLQAIEAINVQILDADKELQELAEKDEVCRRLMTVPGVGPVTSLRFAAALDEVDRFSSAHRAESYLGLTPGEASSSSRVRRTGITKAGSPALRCALVQAAWSLRRWYRNDPMVLWSLQVEHRRGRRVAVLALARKLAGVLFAIWRDGTTYDPARGAAPMKETMSA